jgi:hypothetical protein
LKIWLFGKKLKLKFLKVVVSSTVTQSLGLDQSPFFPVFWPGERIASSTALCIDTPWLKNVASMSF